MNYLLDIETLLQVMQEYRIANARLYAPLGLHNSSYRAEVFVQNGTIISCILRDSRGKAQYQGKEALQIVQSYGMADWSVILETPEAHELAAIQTRALSIPSHRAAIIPKQLHLSRLHIHVFALIDGKRDVENIQRMLPRSTNRQSVEQVLQDLRDLQLIDFG